ncbi:MAG: helix-turn-helix domain-containing protein [Bradyrhizobiaceae bacterium]|nr:helix-turn-helix domain-containing protein [Bradyrhizobiaceae bacterium]
MNTSLLVPVSEHRLAELITDAVASAMRNAASAQSPPTAEDRGNEILTRQELLDELQIAPSTLAAWQRQGFIQPRRIGRRVYFLRRDVDAVLASNDRDWRVA